MQWGERVAIGTDAYGARRGHGEAWSWRRASFGQEGRDCKDGRSHRLPRCDATRTVQRCFVFEGGCASGSEECPLWIPVPIPPSIPFCVVVSSCEFRPSSSQSNLGKEGLMEKTIGRAWLLLLIAEKQPSPSKTILTFALRLREDVFQAFL
jgi:hypothetical protein